MAYRFASLLLTVMAVAFAAGMVIARHFGAAPLPPPEPPAIVEPSEPIDHAPVLPPVIVIEPYVPPAPEAPVIGPFETEVVPAPPPPPQPKTRKPRVMPASWHTTVIPEALPPPPKNPPPPVRESQPDVCAFFVNAWSRLTSWRPTLSS